MGVIKISDDSSTDSDMGLDSDFNSSPESVLETDDVIFIEHAFNGFVTESRSKQSQQQGLAPFSLMAAPPICNFQVTLNFCISFAGNFHMQPSHKEMHGLRELEHVEKMKQDLLAKVKALGKELPLNTLDELINHFGGPEHVAEVPLHSGVYLGGTS